jgi:hypothetical protein
MPLKNELLVSTKEKLSMISMSWLGGHNQQQPRFDGLVEQMCDSTPVVITWMEYNRTLDIFVAVLSDNSVFMSFEKAAKDVQDDTAVCHLYRSTVQ